MSDTNKAATNTAATPQCVGTFLGARQFYNWIKSGKNGENSPTEFYYFNILFYSYISTNQNSNNSNKFIDNNKDNVQKLRYCIQSIQFPQINFSAYDSNGNPTSTSTITNNNMYGTYTIFGNSYLGISQNTIKIRILNTQSPIIQKFIYPWMIECLSQKTQFTYPFPRLNMAVMFYKAGDLVKDRSIMDTIKPQFIYYIKGMFPISIQAIGPKHAGGNGDNNRDVEFSFNQFLMLNNESQAENMFKLGHLFRQRTYTPKHTTMQEIMPETRVFSGRKADVPPIQTYNTQMVRTFKNYVGNAVAATIGKLMQDSIADLQPSRTNNNSMEIPQATFTLTNNNSVDIPDTSFTSTMTNSVDIPDASFSSTNVSTLADTNQMIQQSLDNNVSVQTFQNTSQIISTVNSSNKPTIKDITNKSNAQYGSTDNNKKLVQNESSTAKSTNQMSFDLSKLQQSIQFTSTQTSTFNVGDALKNNKQQMTSVQTQTPFNSKMLNEKVRQYNKSLGDLPPAAEYINQQQMTNTQPEMPFSNEQQNEQIRQYNKKKIDLPTVSEFLNQQKQQLTSVQPETPFNNKKLNAQVRQYNKTQVSFRLPKYGDIQMTRTNVETPKKDLEDSDITSIF